MGHDVIVPNTKYLSKLLSQLKHAKRYSTGWCAQCPAHDDSRRNLRIYLRKRDGGLTLSCTAGCTQGAILEALGLTEVDLQPAPELDPPQPTTETANTSPNPDSNPESNESNTNTHTDPVDTQTTADNPTSSTDTEVQPNGNGNGHTTGVVVNLATATKPTDPITALRSRGLTPEDIVRHGLRVISPHEAEASGFGKITGDAIAIPYFGLDWLPMVHNVHVNGRQQQRPVERIRVINPRPGEPKYLSRPEGNTQLFIPKGIRDILSNSDTVIFTEGEFKAIAGTKYGFPTCGIQGVSCWHDTAEAEKALAANLRTFDLSTWLDGPRKPLLPEIKGVLRYGLPEHAKPRNAYILGDSDLLWNPKSNGRRELEIFADAVRTQVAAVVTNGYCPPICETKWLAENAERLVSAASARDAKAATKLKALLNANNQKNMRAVAEILDVLLPNEFENLKMHKTGLDDWIELIDGDTTQIHRQIMRDLDSDGTSAVTIQYSAGDLEPVKRRAYEATRVWPTDSSRVYILNGRELGRITWVHGHPVVDPIEKQDDLSKILSSRMKFCRIVTQDRRTYTTSTEIPAAVLNYLYSNIVYDDYRGSNPPPLLYPELQGVRTAPTVNISTGDVCLHREGYRDGYYWYAPDADAYRKYLGPPPTDDEMRRAVEFFYRPFRESPWADSSSASGALAMALTMLVRDQLDIAPGFVITAPQAETGKSFVAEIVAQIVYGLATDTLPVIDALQWRVNNKGQLDEEELGKVLFSALRARNNIIYFDNVPNGGMLGCATIDALITNSYISGRILTQSNVERLRAAITFIATGNNLEITADTRSRMVLLRQEKMFNSRHFSREKHEWLDDIRTHTVEYRGNLLTILRWILSHRDEIKRALLPSVQCRFPKWNEVVRCGVILAGQHGAAWHPEAGGRLEDPMEAIKKYNIDTREDNLVGLFKALRAVYRDTQFTASDVVQTIKKAERNDAEVALAEALDFDIYHASSVRIGIRLARLQGQVHGGLRLLAGRLRDGVACYQIVPATLPPSDTPPDSTPETPTTTPDGTPAGPTAGSIVSETAPTATAEATQDVPAQFLAELTDEMRERLQHAAWLSLDTETTGLSPNGKAITFTNSTPIGDTTWKSYRLRHGSKWDGVPRLRVLSVTTPDGTSAAWDLDRMGVDAKRELLGLCVRNKVLIGHNLAFDLQWIRHEAGDVWPDRVLDTMLLVRALAPSLSIKLHVDAADEDNDDNVKLAAAALVEATRNKTCGTKLIEVATALGVEMPEGKLWQRPEAWAVENLSESHYRYAVGDTTVVLDVLARLASHVGLQASDPAEFIRACEEQRPAGWGCYVDVFEAGLRSLAYLHDVGLPFDAEGARGHIDRLDEEMAGPVAELIELAPGLTPHIATIVSGGLTHKVKNAFVRAIASVAPDIAKEVVKRAVRDEGKHEGDLDTAAETAWQEFMNNNKDLPGLKIGQKELPEGTRELKFVVVWEKVQESAKRRAMLKTILDCVRADGRLHPRIGIVTVTGRTNSEDPNVQNFPRDPWFRELVRAEAGNVLIAADYSALEMRVAAALAVRAVRWYGPNGTRQEEYNNAFRDAINTRNSYSKELILEPLERVVPVLEATDWRLPLAEVFRAGIDPHVATAILLMRAAHAEGLPEDAPDDVIGWLAGMSPEQRKEIRRVVGQWRQRAKAANFGLLYGQQAAGLHRYAQQSYGVQWTLEEAERTREVWFSSYPDIHFWQLCSDLVDKRWTGGFLARNKYSRRIETKKAPVRVSSTLSGRPLSTLDRTSILNHQDQGSGAEIALRAVNLLPEEWRQKVVNFVHDEIMLEVPEVSAEQASVALKTAMIEAGDWLLGPFGIPTEVEVGTGRTWPKG